MKPQLKKTIYVLSSVLLFLNASASHSESLATTPFWEYQAGWTPPAPAGFNNSIENSPTEDIASILEKIRVYILKFGLYLGFDLESNQPPNAYNALINTSDTILIESSNVKNSFSILASSIIYPLLVPQDDTYKELNAVLGTVFSLVTPINGLDVTSNQSSSGSDSGQNQTLSPVSQMVLNILSYTPEGFCMSGSTGSTLWASDCKYPYTPAFIMGNALGVPMSNGALTRLSDPANYNTLAQAILGGQAINMTNWYPQGSSNTNPQQNLLNQLDSSVFLTPLIYSKSSNNQQDPNANCQAGSSSGSNSGAPCGLTAQNQVQAAQDFLRYLTGAVLPPTLPAKSLFDSLMTKIIRPSDVQQQITSFDSLTSYLLGVRVYAARQSVAVQNIYEMLGKRIPQDNLDKTFTSSATSQAMDEFIMATYRLFTPNTQSSSAQGAPSASAWQSKISGASSATVEKEMVMLLAEINYQLYQMRQQQEKMLLTQSLIMLNVNSYPLLQDNS